MLRGDVSAPHFPSLPFGPDENIDGVLDFRVGEEVVVELAGRSPDARVVSVRLSHQRQPKGTECSELGTLGGRFGELIVAHRSGGELELWYGDCCEGCSPDALRLKFSGVTAIAGLTDDVALDNPLFRRASSEELARAALQVPNG